MANNVFGALNLKAINGSGALDQIDGSLLTQGDIALVVNDSNAYIYKLYDNDNAQESFPYIIKPVLNGTNKRWRLKSFGEAASDLTVLGKLITDIISFTGSTLTVQVGNQTLATFSRATNSVSFKKISNVEDSTMVTGLNAEFVGGKAGTLLMLSDGSVDFSAPVRGAEPTLPQHLATKNYIDEAIALLDNGSSTNFTVNNLLTASTISSKTNEDLVLKRGGTTVATFGSNGVTLSKIAAVTTPGMVNGLNAEFVGGISNSNIMKKDGTVAFTGAVQGVTPTLSSHLTTKAYVDQNLVAPSTVAREVGGTAYKNFLGINCMPSLELRAYDYQGLSNGAPPEFTFSRNSVATAYGPDGLLYTADANELRHDYGPVTGEYKGWLFEPASTNLLLSSEDFRTQAEGNSVTAWNATACTVVSDAIIAPDGTLSADKLIEDSATTNKQRAQIITVSDGATVTFSVYAKAAENSKFEMHGLYSSNYAVVRVDLVAGTIVNGPMNGSGSIVNKSITNVGNGWYRCSITYTLGTGITSYSNTIRFFNGTTPTYLGNGTNGFYVWGAQVEALAYPTSYIPTASAQATRAADIMYIPTTMFPFNGNEGTLYVESMTTDITRNTIYTQIDDGGANNRIWLNNNTSLIYGQIYTSGSSVVSSLSGISNNTYFRTAIGYATNNTNNALNGTVGTVYTSCAIPNLNTLRFFSNSSTSFYGWIRQVLYFPRRLSDAELQLLTK